MAVLSVAFPNDNKPTGTERRYPWVVLIAFGIDVGEEVRYLRNTVSAHYIARYGIAVAVHSPGHPHGRNLPPRQSGRGGEPLMLILVRINQYVAAPDTI